MAGSSQSEHVERLTASFGVPPEVVGAGEWIPAIVAARTYTIDVTRLESDDRVRVEVASEAAVPTDLAVGDDRADLVLHHILAGIERNNRTIDLARILLHLRPVESRGVLGRLPHGMGVARLVDVVRCRGCG